MDDSPKITVGIAWYDFEDYGAVREVMTDRDQLPNTFTEWRIEAEQREKVLRRQGHVVVRARLRPAEFRAWCEARGLNVDANGRMAWANDFAHRYAKGDGVH